MVASRFYLILALLIFSICADAIDFTGSLTRSECKLFSASNDINKKVQAVFSCRRKGRSKSRKRISRTELHSLVDNDED